MIPETLNNDPDLKVVPSGGCHDCGGRCPYLIHVKDGKALRIEPHEELKACVRGYGYLQRVYAPNRLRFPMKRIGQRGEDRFEDTGYLGGAGRYRRHPRYAAGMAHGDREGFPLIPSGCEPRALNPLRAHSPRLAAG